MHAEKHHAEHEHAGREHTEHKRPAREKAQEKTPEKTRERTREKTRERPPREATPAAAHHEKTPSEKATTEHKRHAAPRSEKPHSAEFAELGLSTIMLDALAEAAYETPTPVQKGFIPRALTGIDVMGQAQTGTGKTAAFAIPILEMLQPHERGAPPQALALVPTRELAVQVRDECEKLAYGRHHSIVAVYGGKPIRKQIEQVQAGASFIVGTPGRVLDLMSRGALHWGGLRVVVLDEADRMLDIGFRPDIEKILRRCPQGRQTLLLSATLAPPVKKLAERYMREPEVLDFSPKNLAGETIEQFYFTVDPERKFDLLVKLLEREDPKQAIIFCRTKRGTDKIHTKLSRQFHHVDTIHGDLQQSSRDRVMRGFRDGKVRWLVATDVIGRGIDVSGISHIINFDIPQFCDDYVHRVGRTGRMGREGVAYTFVSPEEGGELTRIEIRINRLLNRDEIEGFQAFGDVRPAEGVVLGEGPGYNEDDYVESPKPAPLPVFGKPVRRVRRAL
jgi:ATP-dependent RNA helicase DeaD